MVSAFFDAYVLKFEVDILACCCLRKSPPISNGFLIMNQWHEMGARRLTRFDKSLWKSMIYMHESATISQVALKCKAHTQIYMYNIYIYTCTYKCPWLDSTQLSKMQTSELSVSISTDVPKKPTGNLLRLRLRTARRRMALSVKEWLGAFRMWSIRFPLFDLINA